MLASITPVGEAGRSSRWGVTATAYVVGSVLGGATIGLLLGAAGEVLAGLLGAAPRAAVAGLGLLAVAGLVADRRGLPSLRRQVNERWLWTYRGWVYGLGFGAQLGAGLATTVTASATYVAFAAAALAGSWQAGLAIGVTFGLVRSLPLLATARLRTPRQLRNLHGRLHRLDRPVRRAVASLQATVAAAAAILAAVPGVVA